MKLYELVGRDKENGFSPFVWRIKLALEHKGIDYELVPLRFTEIQKTLEYAQSKTVPVLVDGEHVVSDSWNIACYLEDQYPESLPLFNDRAAAKLFNFQMGMPLLAPLFKTIVADIYECLDEEDQAYFRKTREPRIGCTIEEAGADREASFAAFKAGLLPISQYLKAEKYLCGDAPLYQDFALYGMFLWARATSDMTLVGQDDPVKHWIDRMDSCCGSIGARVKKIR